MKKLIVMDNNNMEVHVFNFDENINDTENISEFYDIVNSEFDLHLKDSECSWMIVDELLITVH